MTNLERERNGERIGIQRLVRVYSYEAIEPDENDIQKIPKHLWDNRLTPQYDGKFLGWGHESEQCETGVLNYTCAIVEKADGFVDLVYPKNIQFIDDTEEPELWRDLEEGEVYQDGDRMLMDCSKWIIIQKDNYLIGRKRVKRDCLAQRRVWKEDL